jgi:ParB family chromosome partitioning protein
MKEGLSVRETEQLAGDYKNGKRGKVAGKSEPGKKIKDPVISDLEQKFLDVFGTKVEIKGSLKSGKILISYFSKDDLERVYEILEKRV